MKKSSVISVYIPRTWSREKIANWLKKNKYKVDKVDSTIEYYVFRQKRKSKNKKFSLLKLENGVKLIVQV